jgi:methoxymalonate biosynthesis acyl carrier protein
MNTDELIQRVRQLVVVLCKVENLSEDTDIFQAGLLSSLYALRLVEAIEREFGCSIADDELRVANFCSIAAMAQLLRRKQGAR